MGTVIEKVGPRRAEMLDMKHTGKGRVRRMPSGKFEIIVDAERPIEEWVKELPGLIAAAQQR